MHSWQGGVCSAWQVGLGRSRERLLLDTSVAIDSVSGNCGLSLLHTGDLLTRLTDHGRGLIGVVACGSLDGLESLSSVLGSEILDLRRLRADNVGSVFEVTIDELLVRDVDKRAEEDNGGGEKAEAPEWEDLNQEVSEECSKGGL